MHLNVKIRERLMWISVFCSLSGVYVTTLGSLETYDVLDSQHHIRKHHRDTKAEMPPNIKVTILTDCILSSQRTVNNPLSFCMM